ncbi:MAG: pyruvate formate lyase family protein [Sphaerochaetaceae bacterium]|jgi:formate C-acetyltransferase
MAIDKKRKVLPNERIQRLIDRRERLVIEKRRNLYYDSVVHGIYQWSPGSAAFSPATGKMSIPIEERVCIGDHDARVGLGYPFPATELPSIKDGFSWDPENWARDYAYFLDKSPAEINPDDMIVGEFHWRFDEVRPLKYPADLDDLGFKARALGAGGNSLTHTVVDLGLCLPIGWIGVLEKIRFYRDKFIKTGENKKVNYLNAAETTCLAVIRFVEKHAEKARKLAAKETDQWRKNNYLNIEKVCTNVAIAAPNTFREAVQWIEFYQIAERSIGHGNGYGRLDQYLYPFYRHDIDKEIITKDEARNLIAELLMKYGGNYFNMSGRDRSGKDATNELSWVCVEAYDMVGGHNCMGILWHADIDRKFFKYALEVNKRHGCSTPVVINQDVIRQSELNSGYKPEDAWNVSLGGCQWFCVPGKEYCDQDKNCLVLIQCLQLAFERACEEGCIGYDAFWNLYCEQVDNAISALRDLKNAQYQLQPLIWPEIVSSFAMSDCIEHGVDVTQREVNYAYTSVNLLGYTNVIDALFAIKRIVFNEKRITLHELRDAMKNNWADHEDIRLMMLNSSKFGNDIDEVDDIAIQVTHHLVHLLKSYKNCKGYHFRPSLFHFMGHIAGGPYFGPTPDGRKAEEPLAQGCNPMHGRNNKGITATMKSLMKLPFDQVQGGICQLEIEPSMFNTEGPDDDYEMALIEGYFIGGGGQVVTNVVSVEDLKNAMIHPEKYSHIVVKVTGYSAHFIQLDKTFQQEIINRTRHVKL